MILLPDFENMTEAGCFVALEALALNMLAVAQRLHHDNPSGASATILARSAWFAGFVKGASEC